MIDLNAIKARRKAVTTKGPGYSDSDGDTEFLICARADVPTLVAEVERLQRELHDEQVRHSEWQKMYNQVVEDKEIKESEMTEEVWENGTIDDWTVEQCYQALGEGLVVYIQATMELGWKVDEVIRFTYEGVGDYIYGQLHELVTKAIELGVSFEDR